MIQDGGGQVKEIEARGVAKWWGAGMTNETEVYPKVRAKKKKKR